MSEKLTADIVRSLIFGVEDSLVSTVGTVAGIASAGSSTSTIILTATVLIFVEGFSMAIGSLLSDNSADEFDSKAVVSLTKSLEGAIVMFVSFIVAGFIVLLPFLLSLPHPLAGSIALSLALLFLLGVGSAHVSHGALVRKGIIMALIGGVAIGLGSLVGFFFQAA